MNRKIEQFWNYRKATGVECCENCRSCERRRGTMNGDTYYCGKASALTMNTDTSVKLSYVCDKFTEVGK